MNAKKTVYKRNYIITVGFLLLTVLKHIRLKDKI